MQGVYQGIDCGQAVFFGNICQLCVTGGCCGAGMTKQSLDMTKT